jgi:hypothetical protein
MFDYGQRSNDLSGISGRPGYTTDHTSINGRDAVIVSGRGNNFNGCKDYMAAVYMVIAQHSWPGGTKLMMSGCTKDANALSAIRAVFQSLRFAAD